MARDESVLLVIVGTFVLIGAPKCCSRLADLRAMGRG